MGRSANTCNLHRAVKQIQASNPNQGKKRNRRNFTKDNVSVSSIGAKPVVLNENMMQPQLQVQQRILSIGQSKIQ